MRKIFNKKTIDAFFILVVVAMGVFFKDHCAHMVLHVFAYITIGIDNACFKMLLHSVGDDVLKHHVLGGEVLFYRNKNPEGQRAIDVAQMATVVHALLATHKHARAKSIETRMTT